MTQKKIWKNMRVGKIKNFSILFFLYTFITFSAFGEDKVQTVPLVNLENLSPTFEESKDELENNEEQKTSIDSIENFTGEKKIKKKDKVYINIKGLDKITAKTFDIRLAIGEKNLFGPLEIKALKCKLSENNNLTTDTVAYIQVKDLSSKNNNQVFLFNGWTFVSSPTLKSIDHPIYDLWVIGCENI